MTPLSEGPTGLPVSGKTVEARARSYFGKNSTMNLGYVRLGPLRCALVSPSRLFIYDETYGKAEGIGIGLTPKQRADLLRALDGGLDA